MDNAAKPATPDSGFMQFTVLGPRDLRQYTSKIALVRSCFQHLPDKNGLVCEGILSEAERMRHQL